MTPDVVVDVGNSRIKWGRVADGSVTEMAVLNHDDPVGWKRQLQLWQMGGACRWTIAGVVPRVVDRLREWLVDHGAVVSVVTNRPFAEPNPTGLWTAVAEPGRVGIDRLMGALAARRNAPAGRAVVVLNVGTAMTIDFVRPSGRHVGGAIMPGPQLMARSLHQHTAKLPIVEIAPALPTAVWGENTTDAIQLGIANAVLGAADQMVWDWAAWCKSPPWVFATGGDVGFFRGFVFTADVGNFVIDPLLTLEGVRLAAEALP